jgi:hypothetical protein
MLSTCIVVALLAGCQSARSHRPTPELEAVAEPGIVGPPGFERAPLLLHGFDAPGEFGDQRVDDTLLFGVRIQRGTSIRVEYIRLSKLNLLNVVMPYQIVYSMGDDDTPVTTQGQFLLVERFDEDGVLIKSTDTIFPRITYRDESLHAYAKLMPRDALPDMSDRRVMRATMRSFAYLMQTTRVLDELSMIDPLIARIRSQVVDLPWHAIIPNWTIAYDLKRTDVGDDDLLARSVPARFGRANSIVMPVTLRGHRLTAAHFTLIAPLPPYDLAGGIYRIEAHHPKREDRTMTIQLLAGRRGRASAPRRFTDDGIFIVPTGD